MIDGQWLIIKIGKALRHTEEDIALVNIIRSTIFRQMLEPPLWNGQYTVLEGRIMTGGERRLKDILSVSPLKKVSFDIADPRNHKS